MIGHGSHGASIFWDLARLPAEHRLQGQDRGAERCNHQQPVEPGWRAWLLGTHANREASQRSTTGSTTLPARLS